MMKKKNIFDSFGLKNKFLIKFKYINKTFFNNLRTKYELFNSLRTEIELLKV